MLSADPEGMEPSPLSALRRSHEAFAAGVGFAHVPRPSYLKRLDEHAASDDAPLLIHAPSGAGKSALAAYWAGEYRRKNPAAFIVEHYIGCGEGGTDHFDLIRHVMLEIRERFAVAAELPTTPESLVKEFPAWLWYAREPMILILDGLDRLPPESRNGGWLPEVIPQKVRLIAASTDEADRPPLEGRSWNVLKLKPLTLAERRKAVRQYITGRGVSLPAAQRQSLETDRGSANPLLLRTRLDEVRAAAEGGDLRNVVDYYLGAASLDEMYRRLLSRLEEEFGKKIVAEFFSLLCLSRNGLCPEEIAPLCSTAEGLPPLLQRLDFHMGRRGTVLNFHHNALRQAALERYLEREKERDALRSRLAAYFIALPPTPRTASEGAFQLRELARWNELARMLTDVPVLTAMYGNETKYEYLTYWQAAEKHADLTTELRESLERYRGAGPDPQDLLKGLKAAGDICHITGAWDVARMLYEQMLEVADELKDSRGTADAYSRVGTILWNRGKIDEAEERFAKAAAAAEISGDELLTATIRGNLGNLYFTRGDFARAAQCHEENLSVVERLGTSYDICRVNGNLGSARMRLGEDRKARECFRRMLEIARRNNDAGRIAAAAGNLGNLYYERGNYAKALRCFRRQYAIAVEVGIVQQMATAVGQIGNVYFRRQQLDKALLAYRRQRSVSGRLKDSRSYAAATGNIGLIYAEKGEYRPAVRWFRAALDLYRRTKNAHGVALTYGRLGDLMAEQGKFEKAFALYERQERLAERIGNRPLVMTARAKRGRACHRAGETERAQQIFQELQKEAKEQGSHEMEALALLDIARVLAELNEEKAAEHRLQEAERLARAHGLPHILQQAAEERNRIAPTQRTGTTATAPE